MAIFSAECRSNIIIVKEQGSRAIRQNVSRSSLKAVKQKSGADQNLQLSGLGTGFIVDGSGYIVTNAHVVTGAEKSKYQSPVKRSR
ncbi:hypothetical protein ACFSS9_12270 [Paenibacillus septentrionalis]|uniref:hypothetical protein n=1 Tax=Paenibacillus septentrionalis TaxID=429342 RepID=UPI0036250C14